MTAVRRISSAQGGQTHSRVLEFDVLRAIAILLLLLHHGGIYNFSIWGYSLQNLQPYVQLFLLGSFFFLSGYLFSHSLEKNGAKAFWVDKFKRIVVPYWITLIIFILVLDVTTDPVDLLIHVFGSQMVLSPRFTTPVLTLWYIGLTLTYYLVFGLLLKWSRKPWLLAGAALLVFWGTAFLRLEYGLFARRFFYYFFVFGAGILIARMNWLDRLVTPRFWLLDRLLLFILSILVLDPLKSQVGTGVSLPLVFAITYFSLSAILLTLSMLRLIVRPSLVYELFAMISYASFFVYLLHRPIWQLLVGSGMSMPKQTLSFYLILIGCYIVIPVAFILQKSYDRILDWAFKDRRISKAQPGIEMNE